MAEVEAPGGGAEERERLRAEFGALLWWSLRLRGASGPLMDTAGALLGVERATVGTYLRGVRAPSRPVRRLLMLLGWERASTPADEPLALLERLVRLAVAEAAEGPPTVLPLLGLARDGHPAPSGRAAVPKPPAEGPKPMAKAAAERLVARSGLAVVPSAAGGAHWAYALTLPADAPRGLAGQVLMGKGSSEAQARERAVNAVLERANGRGPMRRAARLANRRAAETGDEPATVAAS